MENLYVEVFSRLTGLRKLFGRKQGLNKGWLFGTPYVMISKPECVEVKYEFGNILDLMT